MITTFSIDKEIRDKANKRAKSDKISLSAVARMLLLDYAEGRISIGTRFNDDLKVFEVDVDKETQEKMDNLSNLWNKKGK